MFFQHLFPGFSPRVAFPLQRLFATGFSVIILLCAAHSTLAQGFEKEFNTAEKVTLTIKSLNGRVTVIASAEQEKVACVKATSTGAPIEPGDVRASGSGERVDIEVRSRRERDRIDITVRIPIRSRVKIEGEAGQVDVMGNVESAEVVTNTGTIHADVPLDNLKFDFLWESSRPRFLSDVELPRVKERSGGKFTLSGKLIAGAAKGVKPKETETDPAEADGDKEKPSAKDAKTKAVRLDFKTQRGVVLLNVDPSMVPPDLHERPLTEAARAIIRSGDSRMMESIRKVSPRMFGDYAKTLPPPRTEPTLSLRQAPGQLATSIAPQ